MAQAFIGLGSNLENPLAQVRRAFAELTQLPSSRLLQTSNLYSSHPVGPAQPDYINAVAELETQLAPLELLEALQAIELAHNRLRLEHWGPRTLDLDILLFDDLQITSERLTLPHPFMRQRNFVMQPLFELAPELVLPCGQSVAQICRQLGSDGLQVLAEEH